MTAAVVAIPILVRLTTPSPVGQADIDGSTIGRAVRMSMTAGGFILLTITLAVYGRSGDFRLSG